MKRIACALAMTFVPAILVPISASAGTTGGIFGVVVNIRTKAPIGNAKVIAISPADVESTYTDASGHYHFISLAPDVYTVIIEHDGLTPVSLPRIAVFADQSVQVRATMTSDLGNITRIVDRAPGRSVRPGITSDVYSYSNSYTTLGPPIFGQAFTLRMTPGVTFSSGTVVPRSPL